MGQSAEALRGQLADQRESLGRDLEAIGDKVSPGRMIDRRRESLRNGWQNTKDRVMGSADDARGSIGSTTSSISSSIGDTASNVADTVTSVPQQAMRTTQGNPLAVGLVAFGAGLVLATLLPETQADRTLAQKVEPTLKDTAREIGTSAQSAIDELKPAAQQAAQDLKDHAQTAADNVKGQATDAASTAADQTKSAVNEVRSQA